MIKIILLLTSGYGKNVLQFSQTDLKENTSKVVNLNEGENLSFIVEHPKIKNVFYAVHEFDTYEKSYVSRWVMNEDGNLEIKEKLPSGGSSPCHLYVDESNNLLYVSNYGGPSISIFNLNPEKGQIEGQIFHEKFENSGSKKNLERQQEAHPHAAYKWRDFVYVVDLGADKIWRYSLKNEGGDKIVKKVGHTELPLGWGPRHMVIFNDVAYVIFELKSRIGVYKINPEDGTFKEIQTVTTIEQEAGGDPEYGAEIQIHPNGKWLYVSNRRTGPILLYHRDPQTNLLSLKKELTTTKKKTWTRHFTISKDGTKIYSVEQHLNLLQVWNINPQDGGLTLESETKSENNPAIVLEI